MGGREEGGRREEGDSVRTIFSNLHKGGVKTFETWESEEYTQNTYMYMYMYVYCA